VRIAVCDARRIADVATLPRSCTQVNIEGTVSTNCGGTYYQAAGNQYVVVCVD
jgi:hypothetical protein